MMNVVPKITLNNGVKMPQLGLGTWQIKNGKPIQIAIECALSHGYRLFDTAAVYGNEQGIGNAISNSAINRNDIFITSKVWNNDQGYDKTLRAFKKSLERLGTDYIDLYLIHWPVPELGLYLESWKAMEYLYSQKRIRAIGVSNFNIEHLNKLIRQCKVIPAVNQIELHPRLSQVEIRLFSNRYDITIESWSPLGGSGGSWNNKKSEVQLREDPIICDIAKKHHKSPVQVIIRWHLQNGLIVIPKSSNPDHIIQNIDIFDFKLDESDMALINRLDSGKRVGADPDKVNFKIPTGLMQLAHKVGLVKW